jgi:hypothetical protein
VPCEIGAEKARARHPIPSGGGVALPRQRGATPQRKHHAGAAVKLRSGFVQDVGGAPAKPLRGFAGNNVGSGYACCGMRSTWPG